MSNSTGKGFGAGMGAVFGVLAAVVLIFGCCGLGVVAVVGGFGAAVVNDAAKDVREEAARETGRRTTGR